MLVVDELSLGGDFHKNHGCVCRYGNLGCAFDIFSDEGVSDGVVDVRSVRRSRSGCNGNAPSFRVRVVVEERWVSFVSEVIRSEAIELEDAFHIRGFDNASKNPDKCRAIETKVGLCPIAFLGIPAGERAVFTFGKDPNIIDGNRRWGTC